MASTHGLGIPDAIRLARALDREPGRLVVFAAEAADIGFRSGLSPAVAACLAELTRAVVAELGTGRRHGSLGGCPAAAEAKLPAGQDPSGSGRLGNHDHGAAGVLHDLAADRAQRQPVRETAADSRSGRVGVAGRAT